ncbi:MAG: Gfo/Idh/MocA family oxidoreductase [Vulcanimicrobiaceae bacterium]
MTKRRVGIVGSSFGGLVHAPSFAAQGSFEVVAIASPSHAADIARARKIPHAFATLDDMLAGCELDVLSVASPPFAHREAVLAGLARGLHVLCEKPFGLNVDEAEEMLAASAAAGTVCALAHEFRYTPSRIAIGELIRNGHLGALRALEVTWNGGFLRAESERPDSWWFERARGGGITGAILSHHVDTATWLVGRPPLRATGYERTAIPARTAGDIAFVSDVADGAFATIDYGEGTIATVTADGTRAVASMTLAVHGETRTAVASGENLLDVTTFVVDEDETSELELAKQAHAHLAAAHPNVPSFVTLLDAFADAITGKPAELPTFADGLATQRVLAAIGYTTSSTR